MQVTELNSEGLSREYKVALPAKEIEEKISFRLKELSETVQLPGFRPGKVPVSLLRKRFGPSVMGEVLERAVNDSSQQALAEKGIRPASQPEIEITSYEDGADLEYTISVEMLPEIEPMDFGALKLERLVPEIEDKEVDDALGRIADQHKSSAAISGDRAAQDGDMVVIDFTGRVDGEEFAGGKAEGYSLELGSGMFIPGFEEQLVGAKTGDQVTVKVNFPDEYGAEELAGKEAEFDVTLHEIQESAAAEVDDELAKKMGVADLDALKTTIREEQGRELRDLSRMHLKKNLLDQLADAHEFEVPPKLLESEFDSIWAQYEQHQKEHHDHDHDHDHGHDHDHDHDHDHGEEKDEEEQKAEFREIAERRVRLGLLLSEVGRNNNIEINQEDVNRAMMEEARKYPGQEQMVLDHFKNTPEALQSLTAPIYEDKVVDFILEMATVSEKPVSTDGFMEALRGDDEENAEKPKKAAKKAAKKVAKKSTKKAAKKTTKKAAKKDS